MNQNVIQLITLGCVIIAAIMNLTNLVSKATSKAASDARIEVKLDSIYTKVDGIEKKQDTVEKTLQLHGERLTAVEERAKSAHHRIDEIRKEA